MFNVELRHVVWHGLWKMWKSDIICALWETWSRSKTEQVHSCDTKVRIRAIVHRPDAIKQLVLRDFLSETLLGSRHDVSGVLEVPCVHPPPISSS